MADPFGHIDSLLVDLHDGIQSYAETAYLMANPKNAERLLQAIARLKAGEYIHVYTRPYTPKTNGKAERFIQTMIREWAYAVPYANQFIMERLSSDGVNSCQAFMSGWD